MLDVACGAVVAPWLLRWFVLPRLFLSDGIFGAMVAPRFLRFGIWKRCTSSEAIVFTRPIGPSITTSKERFTWENWFTEFITLP